MALVVLPVGAGAGIVACMLRRTDPSWKPLVEEWKRVQGELRGRLVVRPLEPLPRFVAGADAAFGEDDVFAAAVVYDREARAIVEVAHEVRAVEVPYVPTFLSFREGPAVMGALGKLKHPFGVVCFDGQGYAHPRRCGLACYVGITLDVPAVGVAKSRLLGEYEEPGERAGAGSPLMHQGEQVGVVMRTRDKTRPIFVSVGNRVDLPTAQALVMACCTKYRIPEPTRQADIEVAKLKKLRA